MKLLEIKHVNKSYKLAGKQKVPVLQNVNISFESGEFVSIYRTAKINRGEPYHK